MQALRSDSVMQSLLQAVGLADSPRTARSQAVGAPHPSRASRMDSSTQLEEPLVPDMVSVAAATEKSIIVLEEQAKTLARIGAVEAGALIGQWCEGLKRQPKADDHLASFKAAFLRSNALEKTLEHLRRNAALCDVLRKEIYPASVKSQLAVEVMNLMKSCMPKGAGSLALPLLLAVAAGHVPVQCATLLLATIQALKEDWQDVVWRQGVRSLERQLNAIEYELDKLAVTAQLAQNEPVPVDKDGMQRNRGRLLASESAQEISRNNVAVLAAICEVISRNRGQAEERASEVSRVLLKLSSELTRWLGQPKHMPPGPAIGSAPALAAGGDVPTDGEELSPDKICTDADPGADGDQGTQRQPPSIADCEEAVNSMMKKEREAMRKGLLLLGLPDQPLQYEPGVVLRLGGHDIRDCVNRMLGSWAAEGSDVALPAEFSSALDEVLQLVASGDAPLVPASRSQSGSSPRRTSDDPVADTDTGIDAMEAACVMPLDEDHRCRSNSGGLSGHSEIPEDADVQPLLIERAAIVEERAVLLERLQILDSRLAQVDSRLGERLPWELKKGSAREAVGERIEPFVPATTKALAKEVRQEAASQDLAQVDDHIIPTASSQLLLQDIMQRASPIADALALESQRSVDRFTAALQTRRAQLIQGLAEHLEGGAALVHLRESRGGREVGGEAMESLWQNAQELCFRVETALGGRNCHGRIGLEAPPIGARCRAKFAGDGLMYDAEVQNVLDDGTIVVNWLRPRAESLCSDTSPMSPSFSSTGSPSRRGPKRPIITVSEHGGDDSCHRWVQQEDVHLLEGDSASSRAVQLFLEARSEEDQKCAECLLAEAEEACISFGIYLCSSCAEGVRRCTGNALPMRALDNVWSWSEEDLCYMRLGGNTSYLEVLKEYPDIHNAPSSRLRYTCKFSEYYRRRLEARTVGVHDTAAMSPEVAIQPCKSPPDFYTSPEAKHVAQLAVEKFEAWACDARRKLPKPPRRPPPRHNSVSERGYGPSSYSTRQPLIVEGCGSVVASPTRAFPP